MKMFWAVFFVLLVFCGAVPLEKMVEVSEGNTVELSCESNDGDHTFGFWELASKNILGPGNEYNDSKYEYDVLTGRLYVRHISIDQEGTYTCFSRDVKIPSRLHGRSIRMIVRRDWALHDQDENTISAFNVVVLVGCILVLVGGSYLIYRKWSRQHRLQGLLTEEDDEEDDSGEEIFSAPGTSKDSGKIIIDRTKTSDDILSTDFGSILSAAND